MAKPILMTLEDWMRDTTVTKSFGRSDKRSTGPTGLQNVDTYLKAYHLCKDKNWPSLLRELEKALDAWVDSKTNKDGTLNTGRNNTTVRLLVQLVKAARKFPDPLPWNEAYPGILIAQDPFAGDFEVPADFRGKVENDLRDLISKDRGKELLTMISTVCEAKEHQVVIQYFTRGSSNCAPVNVAITNEIRRNLSEPGGVNLLELMGNRDLVALGKRKGPNGPEFTPNKGANAVVRYDPDDPGEGKGRPGYIGLAHELVHAYHFVNGLCARQPTGGTMDNQGGAEEEMRAMGARAYKNDPPSENWIRAQWALKERTSYSGNDFSETTATLFT